MAAAKQIDRSDLDRAKLTTAVLGTIQQKGYVVGNGNNFKRFYSKEALTEFIHQGASQNFAIMLDVSRASQRIAESGIPVLRMLRRGAEIPAELKCEAGGRWDMKIYGERNLDVMAELAEELSNKHGIAIRVWSVAHSAQELYIERGM